MVRRQASRKGIVLLIVVSLLALFVLIGVTYVLVGSQYRREATMSSRTRLLHIDPQMYLDRAMYQLVRDTTNPGSAAHTHSLLQDMYGPHWIKRTVAGAGWVPGTNRQFLDLQLDVAGGVLPVDVNGRVLTFLSGPLKNHSTRIVASTGPVVSPAVVRVAIPEIERNDFSLDILKSHLDTMIAAGNCQILINGPAFRLTNPGDPNEDYDAVDNQNLALAAFIPDKDYPDEIKYVIPSFKRPPLSDLDKTSASYTGPLPVDNDGDGVPDSGWIDMGFPVQADKSGRRYKPFFAVLCLDMDGRLNVNAHGSLMQVLRDSGVRTQDPKQAARTLLPGVTGTGNTFFFPKGQGYGPAEINLAGRCRGADGEWGRAGIDDNGNGIVDDRSEYLSEFSDDRFIFNSDQYERLLRGEKWKALVPTDSGIPGRYGLDDLPGRPSYDMLSLYKFYEYPDNYFNNTWSPSEYGSLSDLNGELALGITHLGQPVYESPRLSINVNGQVVTRLDASADNPYELNLVQEQNSDQRFTVAELERVLRYYDIDSASLPSRLIKLAPRLAPAIPASNQARPGEASRRAITTDSFDLPVRPALPDALDWALSNPIWMQLSEDLKAGRRLDVNQAFSNATEKQNYIRSLYLLAMSLRNQNRNIDFDGLTGFERTDAIGVNPVLDNAYGLAQWAVNVVDFRDKDSIMTRFVFDPTPFDANSDQAVVWGCERPELLITETIAWHDRATEDLETADKKTDDADVAEQDEDFDQRLMPRSGFFVELYNPWKGDDNLKPEDLNGNGELDPGEDLNGNGILDSNPAGMQLDPKAGLSPVWRLIVVRGQSKNEDRDPDDPQPLTRIKSTDIERCIYFTNPPDAVPPGAPNPGVESWYQNWFPPNEDLNGNGVLDPGEDLNGNGILNVVMVMPGQYAVIGSRGQKEVIAGQDNYISYLGRTRLHDDGYVDDASETYGAGNADIERPLTRRIRMVPGTSELHLDNNSRPGSADLNLNPTVALPINSRLYPGNDPATLQTASLTITEPVGGYLLSGPNGEAWNGALAEGEGAFTPPLDEPLDDDGDRNKGSGLLRGDLFQDGTLPDYAVIHLQRLANPFSPHQDEDLNGNGVLDPTEDANGNGTLDPGEDLNGNDFLDLSEDLNGNGILDITNPYRTIDSMSVDVTCFNGVDDSIDKVNDPNATAIRFHSLQRGDQAPEDRNIWRHELPTGNVVADPDPGATTHHFNYDLIHRLGYLNTKYHPHYPAGHARQGEPRPDPANNRKPFPWLTWLNRPFVSQYDLMLVPHSRSSRLLVDFTLSRDEDLNGNGLLDLGEDLNGNGTLDGGNPYVLGAGAGVNTIHDGEPSTDLANWPFAHLINFFESTGVNPGLDLHRIFNYTHVPSRFVGTEKWLNPATFTGVKPDSSNPPVYRQFHFREPGRVNINTIFDPAVWDAILDGHEGPRFWGKGEDLDNDEFLDLGDEDSNGNGVLDPGEDIDGDGKLDVFNEDLNGNGTLDDYTRGIVENRRGYGRVGDMLKPNPLDPGNFFSAPFRSSNNVMTSLLRANTGGGLSGLPPLFETEPKINGVHDNARDASRNAYFYYQGVQRLGNLVTTRSNVYAIWITVGFFKVDAAGNSACNAPDEIGFDTGEIERHRAFYFIDRSIPVACEPGQNHNVDRVIILRRYLE